MVLIDSTGRENNLTSNNVYTILGIGWASFFLAFLMNLVYYKFHPSIVDFHPRRFRNRIVLYVFGKNVFPKGWCYLLIQDKECIIVQRKLILKKEEMMKKQKKKQKTIYMKKKKDIQYKQLLMMLVHNQIFSFNRKPLKENQN